jgi:uncharacterized phage infection (PIP) family protein YhgE
MAANIVLSLLPLGSIKNQCIDSTFVLVSIGSGIFGVINIIAAEIYCAIGYFIGSAMSLIALISIKRMRLRATVQKSVNVLKEENNELKENNDILQENNEDLKQNVDTLETHIITINDIEKELRDDVEKLKELLGLVGTNGKNAIEEIKEILNRIKKENTKHGLLVKNQILVYLYDEKNNNINDNVIENFKEILSEFYPEHCWDGIMKKIKYKELL